MSIDSAIYRQVLGHFPTGVTIITGIVYPLAVTGVATVL